MKDTYCRNCGTKIGAGVEFCPECGTKVEKVIAKEVKKKSINNDVVHKKSSRSPIVLIGAGIFVLFILFMVVGSAFSSDSSSNGQNIQTSSGSSSDSQNTQASDARADNIKWQGDQELSNQQYIHDEQDAKADSYKTSTDTISSEATAGDPIHAPDTSSYP